MPAGLWERFAAIAAEHPGKPALVLGETSVDLATLVSATEQVAAWLTSRGLGQGDILAIQLPKRRETYALWLACVRQGIIHAFMDPRIPANRQQSIIERLRPKLLVTPLVVDNPHGEVLRLPDERSGADWLASLSMGVAPSPAACGLLDPAYVMFTSGSTGEPKGAVIPRCGVQSLMDWVRTGVCNPQTQRFSNINPLHFDNAVFDLYGGLLNGATLVPVETTAIANPAHWVKRLREGKATVVFAVPTLFQTLDRLKLLRPDLLPDVRTFLFGGEGFPAGNLAEFHGRFRDHARLINVYGPTETSCICSSIPIDEEALAAAGSSFPSIGRMHPGFVHAILDENGRPVPGNTPGELWIGGANVGLGYYNNPEETARRFRQDPRQAGFRSIWYRTGDLVREDGDGLLWFSGRVDNQVKIRGHRIELEEIDLAIEQIAGVKRAVAVAVPGDDGPEIRALFFAVSPIAAEDVAAHCRARLPVYMQPMVIRQVEALPENANGKTDRKAVAALLRGTP